MQTTDQIIDDILLKSPYGAKAYKARQKIKIENEEVIHVEDEVIDHPQQTYFDFEGDNNE